MVWSENTAFEFVWKLIIHSPAFLVDSKKFSLTEIPKFEHLHMLNNEMSRPIFKNVKIRG